MTETMTYRVPAMHCGHCKHAVESEVQKVEGVEEVAADFESKLVTVRGRALADADLRRAIEHAGYDAEAA